MVKNKPQTFRVVLELGATSLGWTIARLPFKPADVWLNMIRLRVRGEINGHAFRTSLFPQKGHGYYLLVNRAMQKASGARVGELTEFRLEPDLEQRTADLPDELAVLLDEEEGLRAFYESMPEYWRREIGKWVLGVVSDEARLRRAEQMAERLMLSMEGMQELPPIVEAAFRQRPKARLGWRDMNETQRRKELFAVFYYRTPASREKRVQVLCDVAEKNSR